MSVVLALFSLVMYFPSEISVLISLSEFLISKEVVVCSKSIDEVKISGLELPGLLIKTISLISQLGFSISSPTPSRVEFTQLCAEFTPSRVEFTSQRVKFSPSGVVRTSVGCPSISFSFVAASLSFSPEASLLSTTCCLELLT